MIKAEREAHILTMLAETGFLSIRELSARLASVSSITLRRDIADLAKRGALRRTHGGAVAVTVTRLVPPEVDAVLDGPAPDQRIDDLDAIIVSPIEGSGAETLRSLARRRRLPFLAESAPQPGGVYLGPDNRAAGRDLGRVAGRLLESNLGEVRVLLMSHESLPNTRLRCDGFLAGLDEAFDGSVVHWRIDGQGTFRSALRASLDALQAHPEINVIFGVNDHSVLAGIEASDRLGLNDMRAFSVGGEGGALFDALVERRKLMACAALFPEVVGAAGIEVLTSALAGRAMPAEVRTPYAVLTAESLSNFYGRNETGWCLAPTAAERLLPRGARRKRKESGPRKAHLVGFLPHYPAHDWYRNMVRAMEERAAEVGIDFRVGAPRAGIAREIRTMRTLIARAAASRVTPGDTILLNAGEISLLFAHELLAFSDLMIVTNSLDIVQVLSGRAGLKVILTSGEYQAKHRCLVGPSLGALFETMKVDSVFLSVDGISARFGASATDERLAIAARRFAHASRAVFVLADHSLVGNDANHRIAPIDEVDEVFTDSGSLPADRMALATAGVRVSLADEDDSEKTTGAAHRPGGRSPSADRPGRKAMNHGRKSHA